MSNPETLPSIIFLSILRYATYDIANGLQEWRRTLQLLGVCRSWRIQAERYIYSYAFIGDKAKCHTPTVSTISSASNIVLAKQVNTDSFISTISITQHTDEEPLKLLKSIYNILSLEGKSWPQIKKLNFHARFTRISHISNNNINEAEDLMCTIANAFIHNLPSINTIFTEARRPDKSIGVFLDKIICNYCMQLKSFSHTGQPCIKLSTAPCISHLLLHLCEDSRLWLPLANPCQLLHLNLYNASPALSRWFLTNGNEKSTVKFECLERLELSNIGLSSLNFRHTEEWVTSDIICQQPLVQCPRLKTLVLEGICLDACMLQHLLQPPLKTLYVYWWLIDFTEICISKLTFLDKLVVVCDINQVRNIEDFYQRTYSIFAITKEIKSVHLKIYMLCDIDATQINWQHLDCLEICTAVSIETALILASRAPRLTHLKLNNLRPPEHKQLVNPKDFIEKLVQFNSKQKSSKIRKVTFKFRTSCSYSAQGLLVDVLGTCLPKLEKICHP